ncbi:MAG TPA: ElyC/SanA/YdcF family protein [Polyangia bacterium]|nr:ElyC/SanA/YdcF family protein [Polyangia bacterium]
MAEAKAPPRLGRAKRLVLGALGLGALGLAAGNAWVSLTTARDVVATVAEAPRRPVAIVLGNRAFADGSLSQELAARVRLALALYQAKKVQTLFLSGAVYPEQSYDEPGAMEGWLERRGVPREAMILDRAGFRTAATMADAAARGIREAIVCTQGYHLPRALYLARHAGLTATGVAAESPPARFVVRAHIFVRETLARAETVLEVALRGVRASSAGGSKS